MIIIMQASLQIPVYMYIHVYACVSMNQDMHTWGATLQFNVCMHARG